MAANRKMGGIAVYNDHSPRVGVEPANARKHVFKISRIRQVPVARKASTRFAYAATPFSLPVAKLAGFAIDSWNFSDFFEFSKTRNVWVSC